MDFKITEGSSFHTVKGKQGLLQYKKSIEHYFKNFNAALELKKNIPIFLDTNVLLRYYSISFKQRELLNGFFEKRKKQILISKQVQLEFIKNREEVIERYFQTALGGLTQQFEDDVINRIIKFKEEHKEIIKDFQFLDKQITKYKTNLEASLAELEKEIEEKRKQNKLIKFKDKTLTLFSEFQQLDNLSQEEITFLKEEFDSLSKGIDPQKIKTEIKKPNRAFPGMGDIKDKPENPYGDYLLFHEMVKYSKENKKDVAFLTYDSTKGDWLKTNKEPHIHYIQNVYEINSKSIFIIDAKQFFENLFSTSFDSLIANKRKVDFYSIETELEEQIILESISIERLIRTIAEFVVIDGFEKMSLSIIVGKFHKLHLISDLMYHDIIGILSIRNDLMHRDKKYLRDNYNQLTLKANLGLMKEIVIFLTDLYSKL